MADFNDAIKIVEKNEGGFQNNPKDVGNYYPQKLSGTLIGTNRGITPTTYKEYFGKVPTVSDMKALTQEQAQAIYRKLYWNAIKGDSIKDQQIANIMLDSAVNQGQGTSVKLAKEALGVPITTIMDADTVKKINTSFPQVFFNKFKSLREEKYAKSSSSFSQSWIDRNKKFVYVGGGISFLILTIIGIALFIGWQQRKEIGKLATEVIS